MIFDYRIIWRGHNGIVEAGQVYSRKELVLLLLKTILNPRYSKFTVEWKEPINVTEEEG